MDSSAYGEKSQNNWYAIRCIFDLGPSSSIENPPRMYEERITLWRAHSMDGAISMAEGEAFEYAQGLGVEYAGLAQGYECDMPENGSEVYSLIRDSSLTPREYTKYFFDTGFEHQRQD